MGNEDQSLTTHTNKITSNHYHPKKGKHSRQNNPRIDLSNIRCYTCDEKGHIARNCPINKGGSQKKKDNKRRHHAHTAGLQYANNEDFNMQIMTYIHATHNNFVFFINLVEISKTIPIRF